MSADTEAACVVCGSSDWMPLPDPGPQSMASDWRILAEPLARYGCGGCGLARRWPTPASSEALFTSGYQLYAHVPDEARERARQSHYADWIADSVPRPPTRVLDVGCGNGSLLLALGDRWPSARLLGCDPSADSVAHGRSDRVHLWQGTAGNLPHGASADLIVSVNVIEHAPDPVAFARDLRAALTPGGVLVLICPDGGRPGIELLFADHLFSFAPRHLEALLSREGLCVTAQSTAPPELGDFQMAVARCGPSPTTPTAWSRAGAGRTDYLRRWGMLDHELTGRVLAPAVCFGAGETAGLLRAYAPHAWHRLRACIVDDAVPVGATFGNLPLLPVAALDKNDTVLVGVRPPDQARVAARLHGHVARVVTWYDLIG